MKKKSFYGYLSVLVLMLVLIFQANAFSQETRRFHNPTVDGVRLDWCLTWAANCGKPAADLFCRSNGFEYSVGHQIAPDIGYTKILRTGQICNQPMCDGFAFIDCARRGRSGHFPYPMFRGYRLDWCRRWAVDCGAGAAHAFCRSQGFNRAVSWKIDPDIGLRSPTYVIDTGQICREQMCDGFQYINCQ